mmetsp:Transcript_8909/g.28105  ORF Transcript_8909/g.28105 Transcript_8909/m.28105 type:complete len:85 (+) Transcript_8909:2-256(+)
MNWNLQVLAVGGNTIADTGASAIADGLRGNCTLQMLYLNDGRISDAGVSVLANALRVNFTLQLLEYVMGTERWRWEMPCVSTRA